MHVVTLSKEACPSETILKVSAQKGVSLLYVMLEMHHSGQEPWDVR